MNNNIYFWRNTVKVLPKFPLYLEKIQQLCSGDQVSLQIEKLHGAEGLYSMRLDDSARLIYTYYKQKVCLLELLENHQYHRSRFIENPQRIEYVLQALKHSESIAEVVEAPNHSSQEKVIPLELHQQQFIQFNEQQEQVFQQSLPLIVSGPAGSGKTCMAISMILDFIRQFESPEIEKKIVYVTKSKALASQLKANWQEAMPECEPSIQVEFMHYSELLPNKMEIIEDEFTLFDAWFKDYQRILPHLSEVVWQEFRIISGLKPIESYMDLGRKQTQFLELEDRKKCFDLYMGYQKYLSKANQCSPSLYPLQIKDIFDLVVVDEAQDLSYCQLSSLNCLAKQSNIVFFLGEHQLLFDVKSKLNFIKSIYHEQKTSLSQLILSQSYRCPPVVVQLANCIIQTKYQATGGLSDEIENPRIEVAPQFLEKVGEVRWISPEDPILPSEIKLHAKNHYFAVIVFNESERAEASHFFDCEMARVFTPESIKGLEFKMIVVWRPLLGKFAREVNKYLLSSVSEQEEKTIVHRPRSGQAHDAYLLFFNRLITSVTRCQQSLIWVEEEHFHPIQYLIDKIKQGFSSPRLEFVPIEESKQEDWRKLIIKYLLEGNEDGARGIYLSHLKHQYENFEHFCELHGFAKKKEVVQIKEEEKISEVSKQPVKITYQFEHEFFHSTKKKEDWAYKTEITLLTESEDNLNKYLASFLLKFKTGGGLENALFKEKPIRSQEHKKKAVQMSFFEWLMLKRTRVFTFLSCMAKHTQIMCKIPVARLREVLDPSFKMCLDSFDEVQQLFYQQLQMKQISVAKLLNPNIHIPVIHTLLKLKRIDLIAAVAPMGAPLDDLDKDGNTLIHTAVLNKDIPAIQYLHEVGFDFNYVNAKDETVSWKIAGLGDIELYELFSTYKMDWHNRGVNKSFPIQHAVQKGQLELLKLLLKVHPKPPQFLNLLDLYHLALLTDKPVDMVRTLLAYDLDPHRLDQSNKQTPIEMIMELDSLNPHRIELLNLFKEFKCSIDTWKIQDLFTIAHLAAKFNRLEVISWMMLSSSLKPLLSQPAANKILPFDHAIKFNAENVLDQLVLLGEVGGFKSEHFEQFALTAVCHANLSILTKLQQHGMPFNFIYGHENLMHMAIRLKKPSLLPTLQLAGADMHHINQFGENPILCAAKAGYLEAFQQMYAINPEGVDAVDRVGNNVFHLAAQHNRAEILDFLFNLIGLNQLITMTNHEGFTPFLMAIKSNQLKAIESFIKAKIVQERSIDKEKDILYLVMKNENTGLLGYLIVQQHYSISHTYNGSNLLQLSIIEDKLTVYPYLYKLIDQSAKGFLPVFMVAGLGKTAFITLMHQFKEDFYAHNQFFENILHVLFKSEVNEKVIFEFISELINTEVNVKYLMMQMDKNDVVPLSYLVEKKQFALIQQLDDMLHFLWPKEQETEDEYFHVTAIKEKHKSRSSKNKILVNERMKSLNDGLAIDFIRDAIRKGDTVTLSFFLTLHKKWKNSQNVDLNSLIFKTLDPFDYLLRDCVFLAIKLGNLECLKTLAENNMSMNVLDRGFTYTTVEYAIECHQFNIFLYIVEQHRFIFTKQADSLAHSAAIYNNVDVLRWLGQKQEFKHSLSYLKNDDLEQHMTPLIAAVMNCNLDAIKVLNDFKVDFNQCIDNEYDALWFTISDSEDEFNEEVFDYLISRDMDINREYFIQLELDRKKTIDQVTLLIKTAIFGYAKLLPTLILKGARLDWVHQTTKENILFYAIRHNQLNFIKVLADYELDWTQVNHHQENVLHYVVKYGDLEMLEWFLQKKESKPLLTMTDENGRTPYYIARSDCELEMIQLFEKVQPPLLTINYGFFSQASEKSIASSSNQISKSSM